VHCPIISYVSIIRSNHCNRTENFILFYHCSDSYPEDSNKGSNDLTEPYDYCKKDIFPRNSLHY
jgi:hypothetical protein